jgi:signal transduction histidine kinase
VRRRRRLTVTQWFALMVGVLMLVAALGLVAGVFALDRLSDRRSLLTDRIDPANIAALRLFNALLAQETGVRGYALTSQDQFLAPYRSGRVAETATSRSLERLLAHEDLAVPRADVARVRRDAQTWRTQYAQPVVAAIRVGREPPSAALGKRRFDALRTTVEQQQADLATARTQARAELDRAARFVNGMLIGAAGLVVLSILIATLTLRHVIVSPLGRLGRAVQGVVHGSFDRPIEPSGPREVAQLGADVDAMRERIVAEVAALREAELALTDQARELQRSNEELEQFAYVASHDLQEPLRKVASFTQMLERRYKGQLDERADRYIAFAVDGAKRMQDLINDLLAFSRVGRITAPIERVETSELLEQAAARLATSVNESGMEIAASELPAVRGDAGLLTAVFQNLISNAIKFRGDAPPRVEFHADRDGPFWVFTCSDNGIGVEDEYAERIFVIFQRLHTRDAYDGTGIGLAMCRKIIEYHGGQIWLAPAEPGRGARFHFTLPADEPQEEQAA